MKLFVSSLITTILLGATSAWLYFSAHGIYETAYGPSYSNGIIATQDLVKKGDIQVGTDLSIFYILATITVIFLLGSILLGFRLKKISISS